MGKMFWSREEQDLLEDNLWIFCINKGACIRIVSLDEISVHDGVEHIYGDIRDFSLCKELTKGMDFVFHTAGIVVNAKTAHRVASYLVPVLMMNTGMLEACRINGVQKVLYTSSIGSYAPSEMFRESEDSLDQGPSEFGAWAKRMAELQIRSYQMEYHLENFAIVRLAHIYGPGANFHPEKGSVIPSLLYRIYKGETPLKVWGDGSSTRDFLYSRDAAEGCILALYHGTQSGFINIGSGQSISIQQVLETLQRFISFQYEFDKTKPKGYPTRVMDISLAKEKLGFFPKTSLEEGLKKTWNWLLKHVDEDQKKKWYV